MPLVAMRTVITAAKHEVPVSNKGYVDFLHNLVTEIKTVHLES